MLKDDRDQWLATAKKVLLNESQSIAQQAQQLDENYLRACEILLATRGRVIVMGIGKSGHIAGKMAATFASTGTPAFFVHPAEAIHGDLGMITKDDNIISLSYSGESEEILALLPLLQRLGCGVIGITGNAASRLAQSVDVLLLLNVTSEACPLGLAPTSSTTTTLALGDALAITLLQARGFSNEDFARSHPGGRLGKRLLTRVGDIMQRDNLPCCNPQDDLKKALLTMTSGALGTTLIISDGKLQGIYTDGDLRRTLEQHPPRALTKRIELFMTRQPRTIASDALATKALQQLEKYQITTLPVVDAQQVVGIISIHHLLSAGIA